jgi:flagellar export protein FliJ
MSARPDKLGALERLTDLEVEQARIQHTALENAADEQRKRVAEVRAGIAQTRDFEQNLLMREDAVSVESLRHVQSFLQWRAQELVEQQANLTQAEDLASNARATVIRRFERLLAICRLRERRVQAAALDLARAEQKQLDDRAIIESIRRSKE